MDTIVQVEDSRIKSFLDCSGIRHPIVEKIHTDTEYVKNDIVLGKDEKDGILLLEQTHVENQHL